MFEFIPFQKKIAIKKFSTKRPCLPKCFLPSFVLPCIILLIVDRQKCFRRKVLHRTHQHHPNSSVTKTYNSLIISRFRISSLYLKFNVKKYRTFGRVMYNPHFLCDVFTDTDIRVSCRYRKFT